MTERGVSEPLTDQELMDLSACECEPGELHQIQPDTLRRLVAEVRELRAEIERRNDDSMDYLTLA